MIEKKIIIYVACMVALGSLHGQDQSNGDYETFAPPIVLAPPPFVEYDLAQMFNDNYEYKISDEIYVEVDYLCWFAHIDGLSPSLSTDFTEFAVQSEVNIYESKGSYFKNQWDSGVRGTIGYIPLKGSCDLFGSYTYFQSSQTLKKIRGVKEIPVSNESESGTLVSNNFIPNSIQLLNELSFDIVTQPYWNIQYNQIDIEFGRGFEITKSSFIRPFFGVRGLWVEQEYNFFTAINYVDKFFNPFSTTVDFESSSRFLGAGVKAGFELNYQLIKGFSLYGVASTSLLFGQHKIKEKFFGVASDLETVLVEGSTFSPYSTVFNFDIDLGIKWNKWLSFNRYLLTVKLGWEQHIYSDMNQLQNLQMLISQNTSPPMVDQNISRGSLSLSGFVLGAAITY